MSSDPCTQFPSARSRAAAHDSPARLAPSAPRVLSIAGTDPTGGAGTAADLKSITAAGGTGMAAVTAVVAQNTHGVRDIHLPPAATLAAQLAAVSDDVTLDAVKTGMLATAEIIDLVEQWVRTHRPPVLVVDPVMVATSGDRLLAPEAEQAMLRFCRLATVVTPNIDELAVLTGTPLARDEDAALAQAQAWAAETGVAVLVKTGHLTDREVSTTWVSPDGTRHRTSTPRVDTQATHGTGCSLAAALATRLGAGDAPPVALARVTDWLHEAIVHGAAQRVGSGHGPVDHAHRSRRLAAAGSASPWLAADAVPARWEHPEEPAPEACTADGGEVEGRVSTVREPEGHSPAGPVVPVVAAAVAPAGPWTEALWAAGAPLAAQIEASGFVAALVDGSLPEGQFSFYLAQDAHYLQRYSRALAALAGSANDPEAREFWAASSRHCLETEMALHRDWLAHHPASADVPVGPVTSAYTDFLLARALGDPHVVGAAAALPCFWLYAQVGAGLPEVPEGHPYAAWLLTYRDPGFVEGVRGALAIVERELAAATPEDRAEAARSFLLACRHELEFFEQARRIDPALVEPAAEWSGVAEADAAVADAAVTTAVAR